MESSGVEKIPTLLDRVTKTEKMKKQENKTSIDDLNEVYNECLEYLESVKNINNLTEDDESSDGVESESSDNDYESIKLRTVNEHSENGNESSATEKSWKTVYEDVEKNGKAEEIERTKLNCIQTELELRNENTEVKIENVKKDEGIHQSTEANKENKETKYAVENENIEFKVDIEKSNESIYSINEPRSERLRKLSRQLPKIVITTSSGNVNKPADNFYQIDGSTKEFYNIDGDAKKFYKIDGIKMGHTGIKKTPPPVRKSNLRTPPPLRTKTAYGVFPKRLVSKSGIENVALISNVPFEKIRLLNDTFHTLINLRWRWIVSGTVVVHFGIWLIFAVWWYVAALAHYDLEPDPPRRACVTGGKDFVTIFLASVEAQTTIGFGDRAIDEECPEAIFLFIMQLILGTGLSGVLTCVVYAKLTRPEKLSRDGVGFSKKAVISLRDGSLCLMIRAWDLNYDHIISSDFSAHFITTHRTKEGETLRYYARSLQLQQRQFLLWPVTLVHVIDEYSPLFRCTPELLAHGCYEITVSLKGASASMGTFTQSQTSYMPREVIWGHRFPPVVKYDKRKQKYVIDHKKLDVIEPVDTPYCSASQLYSCPAGIEPETSSSFSERISSFVLERSSSFRRIHTK